MIKCVKTLVSCLTNWGLNCTQWRLWSSSPWVWTLQYITLLFLISLLEPDELHVNLCFYFTVLDSTESFEKDNYFSPLYSCYALRMNVWVRESSQARGRDIYNCSHLDCHLDISKGIEWVGWFNWSKVAHAET